MKAFVLAVLLGVMPAPAAPAVIPVPAWMAPADGAFNLDAATAIVAPGPARPLGETLAGYLRPATGLPLPVLAARPGGNALRLALDPADRTVPPGGYRLRVDPQEAELAARDAAGLFHGLQTLRQLLPSQAFRAAPAPGVAWALPALAIDDHPRFPWRGSHLDVGRHLLPVAFIKKHLDLMALHKLNVFHWHLTEDQGWRLEIRRHPRLARIGGWRTEPGPVRYGGHYTQEEVREIVRYAADRFITVVPEIEMPGHCTAALAAYPELGNDPGRAPEVPATWGVFSTIFNVGEPTLAFLEDVLDEVLDLFPSRYVHIGGDECPRTEWAASSGALARMVQCGLVPPGTTREDLASYRDAQGRPAEHPALAGLQSWFVGRMGAHLAARGRRLVGWDEILDGGLAPGATVMCWRGEAGAVAAARAGHDVVMAPFDATYFSQDETRGPEPPGAGGFVPLERAYALEPVPAGLTPAEAGHILGAQGQLWTEYVAAPELAEYRLWPRLAALAEAVWSPPGRRDFQDFRARLGRHLERLDALGVGYHPQSEDQPEARPEAQP